MTESESPPSLSLTPLEPRFLEPLAQMISDNYVEDPGPHPVSYGRAREQVVYMLQHPEKVRALLFLKDELPIGYSLLVPYWSNEFGGDTLYVDELYLAPPARNQGLGSRFLLYVKSYAQDQGIVRLMLEVYHCNPGAKRLYLRHGFQVLERDVMGFQIIETEVNRPSLAEGG